MGKGSLAISVALVSESVADPYQGLAELVRALTKRAVSPKVILLRSELQGHVTGLEKKPKQVWVLYKLMIENVVHLRVNVSNAMKLQNAIVVYHLHNDLFPIWSREHAVVANNSTDLVWGGTVLYLFHYIRPPVDEPLGFQGVQRRWEDFRVVTYAMG